MPLSKHHREMHWLASRYADRPDVVQGAGGNFSVKIDRNVMLVKASGMEFRQIGNGGRGLVPVLYRELGKYLSSKKSHSADEKTHLNVVRSCTIDGTQTKRPSMEVWFHTLLPTYVLHTHSVYVNILACSKEGAELFHEIMAEAQLPYCTLPYCNPGFDLGRIMTTWLGRQKNMPPVIFLENHGVIVAANSAEECAALHELVEAGIKKMLGIKKTAFPMRRLNEKEADDFRSLILFPDQTIYPERADIRAAHRFILKHIRNNGLHAKTISSADVNVITNMESEKHRKKLQRIK